MDDLTHASFFSGVGGLDLGLERAGWRTVSFSEVDPYASAVLAERWPGVPNLGDITSLGLRVAAGESGGAVTPARRQSDDGRDAWRGAVLWSGGFPCQDLSVAGKRRGLAGARSGLAFAFLDLVARLRPPWVLMENVPGLLSSHGGRDLGTLLGALGDAGYGWAYRVLDARWFGVPQRRRRVFILAHTVDGHPDADGPSQVLAVGTRCGWHPPTGGEAWEGAAEGTGESTHGVVADGATSTRPVPAAFGHHGYAIGAQDADGGYLQLTPALPASLGKGLGHNKDDFIVTTRDGLARAVVGANRYDDDTNTFIVDGAPPDPDRVRAPDGLAGRLDGGDGLAGTLRSGGAGGVPSSRGEHLVVGTLRVGTSEGNAGGSGHALPIIVGASGMMHDEPPGLDSHRYRCCGNGVVSSVAEWIGLRLRMAL